MQAGERDVCASLAATAMLLGQLGAETLEKGHQKLLEHCAEDPSCCANSTLCKRIMHTAEQCSTASYRAVEQLLNIGI